MRRTLTILLIGLLVGSPFSAFAQLILCPNGNYAASESACASPSNDSLGTAPSTNINTGGGGPSSSGGGRLIQCPNGAYVDSSNPQACDSPSNAALAAEFGQVQTGIVGCQNAASGGTLGASFIDGLLDRLPANVGASLPGTVAAVSRAGQALPGASGIITANATGRATYEALGGGVLGQAGGSLAGTLAGGVARDITDGLLNGDPGSVGGTAQGTVANLGGSLTNALNGLGNRVSVNLTRTVATLPRVAGSIAGYSTGSAISEAVGGGIAGNILGSIGADIAGNLANDIGNKVVGSALKSLGFSSLGGLAGGLSPLGGLGLGGGLALGGGLVPVSDSTAQKIQSAINADTRGIYGDTASLVRKECITDPLTRRSAQRARTILTANIVRMGNQGLGGGSYAMQPGYLAQAYNAANVQFIQSPELNAIPAVYQSRVRQQLATNFQRESNFGGRVGCSLANPNEFIRSGTPQNGLGYWDTWLVTFQEPGCTQRGAALLADNERLQRAQAKTDQVQATAEQGNGYLPVTECLDGSGTNILDCQNYKVVTPSSLVRTEYEGAVRAGEEDLVQIRETGEVIDGLFAQMGQTSLLSFQGALGLSSKRPAGGGSYLEQVTGTVNATAATQAKGVVGDDIRSALIVHATYQNILEEMLTNIRATATVHTDLGACYAARQGALTTDDLLRKDVASTTAATLIAQVEQKTAELARAKNRQAALEGLMTRMSGASTPTAVNSIASEFDQLSATGALYTTGDATLLANDRDGTSATLTALKTEAETQLAQCKSL